MKNNYVSLLIITFCFSLGFILSLTLNQKDEPSQKAQDTLKIISQLQQEKKQLQQENITLTQQLKNLHSQSIPVANQEISHNNFHQSSSSTNNAENKIIPENKVITVKQSDGLSNWLLNAYKENPQFSLAHDMQLRFEKESVDLPWAEAQEQMLRDQFSSNPTLSGAALKDIKCRSTKCQVTLNITDIEQANSWVGLTASALQLQTEQKIIIATPELTKNMTSLYIDMGGQGFGFQ